MKIHNVRLGFAANSSSTHSLIFLGGVKDYDAWGRFGWQHFTAASSDAKMRYLAITLFDTLRGTLDDSNACIIVKELTGIGVHDDMYVDHQSEWVIPQARRGGVNVEFFEDFKAYLLQENLRILGGSNDNPTHPLGGGFTLAVPTDWGSIPFWARKDGNVWVLFNAYTGAKVRISFTDEEYTKSTLPELVDLKITNYCSNGCKWCYQGSNTNGVHAETWNIRRLLSYFVDMGVFEVAIGGGDALEHPDFWKLLSENEELVLNFTTHRLDWLRNPHKVRLVDKNVGGFAYSATSPDDIQEFKALLTTSGLHKASIQLIVGTQDQYRLRQCLETAKECDLPVTLLGYKDSDFTPEKVDWISVVAKLKGFEELPRLSVDTLLTDELDRLGINELLYHKEEGKFSMYVDAVKMACGASSYCNNMIPLGKDLGQSMIEAYGKF